LKTKNIKKAMQLDIETKSTIIFSLALSIQNAEESLEKTRKILPEFIEFYEKQLASFKEAKEKMLQL